MSKSVLAEILKATRLGAVFRVATFGEAVDAAVGDVLPGNPLS